MWEYGKKHELYHWGIKGQKWGIRRYQNEDGSLTPEGRERYGNLTDKKMINDAINKDKLFINAESELARWYAPQDKRLQRQYDRMRKKPIDDKKRLLSWGERYEFDNKFDFLLNRVRNMSVDDLQKEYFRLSLDRMTPGRYYDPIKGESDWKKALNDAHERAIK